MITERSGDHSIQVRAFEAGATGRYELHVDRLRSATSDDRKRVDLQTGVLAGNALIARGGDANVAEGIRRLKATANLARAARDFAASRAIHAQVLPVDAKASLETLGVASVSGARSTYASRGSEQRARDLRGRLDRAIGYFESKLRVNPDIVFAVLAQDDWAWFTTTQYGIPWAAYTLVCLPATHPVFDEYTAAMRRQWFRRGDASQRARATGLSLEEGMRLAGDNDMFHELGHHFVAVYGIARPNRWLSEFAATYLAEAYRAEMQPDPRGRVFTDLRREWQASLTPKYRSLDDFERLYDGVGAENYGWYQGQFQQRAIEVYRTQGLSFIEHLKSTFPATGPTTVPLPVRDVLARLDAISPGFTEWGNALTRSPR